MNLIIKFTPAVCDDNQSSESNYGKKLSSTKIGSENLFNLQQTEDCSHCTQIAFSNIDSR